MGYQRCLLIARLTRVLLPPVRPKNGDVLLVLVVPGFFDDIMPLLIRDIYEEYIACLMILDGVLEFLWHHFFPEEPAGIAMGGIAVHRVLIGELFERNAFGIFFQDKLPEAVDLGGGERRAIEEDIVSAEFNGFRCLQHLIGHIAYGEDIAFFLPQ